MENLLKGYLQGVVIFVQVAKCVLTRGSVGKVLGSSVSCFGCRGSARRCGRRRGGCGGRCGRDYQRRVSWNDGSERGEVGRVLVAAVVSQRDVVVVIVVVGPVVG